MINKKSEFPVKFFKGTAEQYASIIPNMYTFYFITDVDKVYLGDIEISNRDIAERIEYINQQLAEMEQELDKKTTIQMKTVAEWNQLPIDYRSKKGSVYIFSDLYHKTDQHGNIIDIPGIKIGTGGYLADLPFIDDLYYKHIYNSDIHVTLGEKAFWNNKINVDDSQEVVQEQLIFNRN